MKNLLLLAAFATMQFFTYGQGVAINPTGVPADPSAILDVSSHTQGVLVPRLRTNERLAIVGPANGLLAYDIEVYTAIALLLISPV